MSKKSRRERELAKQAAETSMDVAAIEQIEKQEQEEEAQKIDFDGWWAARAKLIAPQHHKEIVKADFGGRGLTTMETMEDFDDALREYGIKL